MAAPLMIGLAGLGTVGAGVLRLVHANADLLAARAGRPLRITAVSARDRARDRGVRLDGLAFEDRAEALADRPDVDVVVEAIGGADGPALALAHAALAARRPLVTANKAMIAHHGHALAAAAEAAGVPLRFEAAVAGAIPVVKALREGAAANRIARVAGILNGTCNLILTAMEREGRDFAAALADAQAAGFAEADPSFDVDGIDAAHKLAILAAIAFGTRPAFERVAVSGIRPIRAADHAHAQALGYRIRLVGVAAHGSVARVCPVLVPADHPLAAVCGPLNAVAIEGDQAGRLVLSGAGAGAGATASAIVADLVDIAAGRAAGPAFGVPASALAAPAAGAPGRGRFYLRLDVADRPGVLAELTAILRDADVSVETLVQPSVRGDGPALLVILTHPACEQAARRAADAMTARDSVCGSPLLLPILEGDHP